MPSLLKRRRREADGIARMNAIEDGGEVGFATQPSASFTSSSSQVRPTDSSDTDISFLDQLRSSPTIPFLLCLVGIWAAVFVWKLSPIPRIIIVGVLITIAAYFASTLDI